MCLERRIILSSALNGTVQSKGGIVMDFGAERMSHVQLSQIREILDKARALETQGKSVIHLEIGEPDFDTPAHIIQSAQRALAEGQTHYGPNRGVLLLRQAIANKLAEENGISADPEQEIIVTVGAAEALLMSFIGLLNPGDQVIIIEPAFINYVQLARMAQAEPIIVKAEEKNGWQVDPVVLEQAITPKTKMVVINTPNNPTGAVYSGNFLQTVADLAIKYNLLVVADEIYEKIIYPGSTHISIATLPGMSNRTITINGYSKAYSMTGWRLAYVVAVKELIMPMLKVHQYTTTCAPTFVQAGAIAATSESQDCVRKMVAEFARRRALVCKGLSEIPGFSCHSPQGAFYAFVNIKSFRMSSTEFVGRVLNDTGVALVPGTAFGEIGEGFARISYANTYENIGEALKRLSKFSIDIPH